MAIVQNAPSGGIVVLPTVGPPGVSIVGPRGGQGEAGPEGRQGRTGDQGPAGAGALISRTATVTIAPWTAIIADGIGGCRPADPSNPAQRQQVIAITANGGATNAIVQGQNTGDLLGPNAGFVPGATLFVGVGGALTATPPTSGWRQAVAVVVADGHIVVNLGEATLIPNDVALIDTGGFATKAAPSEVAAGSGPGWTDVDQTKQVVEAFGSGASYTAPLARAQQRDLISKVGDFGYTPYDYIFPESDRQKVRSGAPDAPSVDNAFRAFFADLVAAAGNTGIRATIPPGVYLFDSAVEVELFSTGSNQRRYCLDIAPGAKFVHSPTNRYRFVVLGPWDPSASPTLISSMSGAVGDAYVAIAPNDNLNIDFIKSLNVGDYAYRGVNGWQKILCKADYHMQYLDASTNLDSKGNQVVFAGQGREGDTYIIGAAGSLPIDGLGSLAIGDEIIMVWGAWRKKTIRGGTFKGYWKPSTNTLYSDAAGTTPISGGPSGLSNDPNAPNNAGGTPGDWYIAIGPRGINPSNLGQNYVTGLGESSVFGQGQRIWCRSPGKWHKAYASPTPRGRWNPVPGTYSGHYYPSSHPATTVSSTTSVPAVYSDDWLLNNAGEYGATYEVTFPGTGTVNGITRNWQRGEYIFRGPNGFEFIPRDPNYNRGIFLFHIDEITCLHIHGTLPLMSRDTGGLAGGYSAGVAMRVWSNKRVGVANYSFGSPMLWIKGTLYSESDAASIGDALFTPGIWEKVLEVRNLYLPTVNDFHIRAPGALGATRKTQIRQYPRTTLYGIHFIDAYVGQVFDGNVNASFIDAIRFDSDAWDQDMYSYEGGVVRLDGATVMTAVYVNRGWRETVGGWRSTFAVHLRDVAFAEYGARIKGTVGVRVTMDRPILPGPFSGVPEFFDDRPAAVMLEDCASVSIDAGIPASGMILSDTQYSSVLRTRSNVCDVSIRGDFGQMDGGCILDLHHNGNDESRVFYWGTPQQLPSNAPGRNITVTLRESTGLDPLPTKALIRGNNSLWRGPVVRGDVTYTDSITMGQGKPLVLGPVIINTLGDKLFFSRASDNVPILSIDLNGTLRAAGPVLSNTQPT